MSQGKFQQYMRSGPYYRDSAIEIAVKFAQVRGCIPTNNAENPKDLISHALETAQKNSTKTPTVQTVCKIAFGTAGKADSGYGRSTSIRKQQKKNKKHGRSHASDNKGLSAIM